MPSSTVKILILALSRHIFYILVVKSLIVGPVRAAPQRAHMPEVDDQILLSSKDADLTEWRRT